MLNSELRVIEHATRYMYMAGGTYMMLCMYGTVFDREKLFVGHITITLYHIYSDE